MPMAVFANVSHDDHVMFTACAAMGLDGWMVDGWVHASKQQANMLRGGTLPFLSLMHSQLLHFPLESHQHQHHQSYALLSPSPPPL